LSSIDSRKSALIAAVIALAVPVVGCGSATTVGSGRTLTVALSEYRLNPDNVRVKAGYVTIVVRNYGHLTHNLSIALNGQSAGATKPIPPGQSALLTLSLTPGTYMMSSTLLSDEALGEYGTLTVTS
jgi:plastocyanin